MAKWFVNAPGALPVEYPSASRAAEVAAQVKGGFVTKGRPAGRHAAPMGLNSGIGTVPSPRKSLWQRLVG